MKKLAFLLLAIAILAVNAGCGDAGDPAPPASSSSSEAAKPAPQLEDIFAKIHEAYGEDYLATSPMPVEYIENAYGLSADLYDEARGEMAAIIVHPDEIIIVKAKPGKADEVEKALTATMERKKADTLQYPMNIPKTEASQVFRNDDYVAYVLLGAPMKETGLVGENDAKNHFEAEVKKGIDAINSFFE